MNDQGSIPTPQSTNLPIPNSQSTNPQSTNPFLTAHWRYLVMLNYEIDPQVLRPMVPYGTELDTWDGRTFASMVGFLFLNTRVLGIAIPFHTNFEEVNLRFYVRRKAAEGWRRGVVFVKEIVPRWAIAGVARYVYGEKYAAMPMRHTIAGLGGGLSGLQVEYAWYFSGAWQRLAARASGEPQPAAAGSEEEFISEHYWGYSAQRDGGTVEYRVEHPRWKIWQVSQAEFDCDVGRLYGPQFESSLCARPTSAFLADGSEVAVYKGLGIRD